MIKSLKTLDLFIKEIDNKHAQENFSKIKDYLSTLSISGGTGPQGPAGPAGAPGAGVPIGGAINQLLKKNSATNYDTSWVTVDKTFVGLSNVPNIDCTDPNNIAQDATHRFVTDTEKATWNAKENAIASGTIAQYWRGDKTWQTLDKAAVGLGNVDDTSDVNKPISTAAQAALDLKANLYDPLLYALVFG